LNIFYIYAYKMMYKLFVVGFPRDMDENGLKEVFDDFGDVERVTIVTEPATGQSKGYAFVSFLDEAGARLAIRDLDQSKIAGRTLNVRFAEEKNSSQGAPGSQNALQGRGTAREENGRKGRRPRLRK
jgi:RNA recognition motif-containing protein